jgi:ketosteroid isomerase-like protein
VNEVITRYLKAAPENDVATLLGCFTDDAVVRDEGHTYRGKAEIEGWRAATAAAFTYTVEVLGGETADDGRELVRTRLAGTFPGSPVELTFAFTLRGDLISGLVTG